MTRKPVKRRGGKPKARLGLPDLDQSKAAVISSLRSPESQRGYRQAIDEFIDWYCSEPRLSFNRTVVLRYRIHLESRNLAAGTINVRLAAVRRLAYEAGRCRVTQPRARRRHPTRKRRQETWRSLRKLVVCKGSSEAVAIS